jgi:hypothetical protein
MEPLSQKMTNRILIAAVNAETEPKVQNEIASDVTKKVHKKSQLG